MAALPLEIAIPANKQLCLCARNNCAGNCNYWNGSAGTITARSGLPDTMYTTDTVNVDTGVAHVTSSIRTACRSQMRGTGVDGDSYLNTSVTVLVRVSRYTLTARLTG